MAQLRNLPDRCKQCDKKQRIGINEYVCVYPFCPQSGGGR